MSKKKKTEQHEDSAPKQHEEPKAEHAPPVMPDPVMPEGEAEFRSGGQVPPEAPKHEPAAHWDVPDDAWHEDAKPVEAKEAEHEPEHHASHPAPCVVCGTAVVRGAVCIVDGHRAE